MPSKPGKGKTQLFNSYFGGRSVTGKAYGSSVSSKGSSGSSNRPIGYDYNKNLVKVANERLRKLEKVSKMASQSPAYKTIQKLVMSPNSPSAKFYKLGADGSVRFINKTEYSKLTPYEQKKYNEALNAFLNNQTSTKLGIQKARKDAYDAFMENHPNLNWTQEDYERFWKNYSDSEADGEDKNRYQRLTGFFNNPDPDYASNLTDEKIEEIMSYTNNERRYSNAPVRQLQTNDRRYGR